MLESMRAWYSGVQVDRQSKDACSQHVCRYSSTFTPNIDRGSGCFRPVISMVIFRCGWVCHTNISLSLRLSVHITSIQAQDDFVANLHSRYFCSFFFPLQGTVMLQWILLVVVTGIHSTGASNLTGTAQGGRFMPRGDGKLSLVLAIMIGLVMLAA